MAKLALAKALKKKNMSKNAFAKALGVEKTRVRKYFKGGINPTLKTLNKWATAIGAKVRDLLEE